MPVQEIEMDWSKIVATWWLKARRVVAGMLTGKGYRNDYWPRWSIGGR
jgi:hypothetical protein